MIRERGLKIVLVLMGLICVCGAYPLMNPETPAYAQMLFGVYATLGVFLLLALRNPAANRSLIAFTAWSTLVHAAIMAVQVFYNVIGREFLFTQVVPFALIGVALIVFAPAKSSRSTSAKNFDKVQATNLTNA